MASVNSVTIIGNCTKDCEIRYTANGEAMCNITVATNERWKNKEGQQQEHSEFHRISAFGKLAEIMGEYLRKGSQVYIEGKLRTRKWTDKDGVEKFSTDIIADKMQMLGGRQ